MDKDRPIRFDSVKKGDILTFSPSLSRTPIYYADLSFIVDDFAFNRIYLKPATLKSTFCTTGEVYIREGCVRPLECLQQYWHKHTEQEIRSAEVLYG